MEDSTAQTHEPVMQLGLLQREMPRIGGSAVQSGKVQSKYSKYSRYCYCMYVLHYLKVTATLVPFKRQDTWSLSLSPS